MEGILGSMTRAVNDLLLLENTRPQPTTVYQTKVIIGRSVSAVTTT